MLFVDLYGELKHWMGERPSVLRPYILDKQWDYVDFPMTVEDIRRRFVCGSLLVLPATLDPKHPSIPVDFLDSLRAVQAGTPHPNAAVPTARKERYKVGNYHAHRRKELWMLQCRDLVKNQHPIVEPGSVATEVSPT